MTIQFPFNNTYAKLPERFFARLPPTPVSAPKLIQLNRGLALELGLDPDQLAGSDAIQMLAGQHVPEGADPIAMAYAGHQFGSFVTQLGDGRAVLLGEVLDRHGRRSDIQLKGSGPTPFSRRGDGRAAIGPVLREYLVSEAMAALGVPTTRALAAVTTGELVQREILLPGAVLARVAASHIRVGTFQYFAARGDVEGLRLLADHVIARHYPCASEADRPYLALLEAVVDSQAKLLAQWMLLGFIHGVMNTDNMSIAGETIDYGPCAFMDAYDPTAVFSSIDRNGRYAYGNQPRAAHWNLGRFAETLLPLLAETESDAVAAAENVLTTFVSTFETALHTGLSRKLGLFTEKPGDLVLATDFLNLMAASGSDFTLTFRHLSDATDDSGPVEMMRRHFTDAAAFDDWAFRWRERLAAEPQNAAARARAMKAVNPAHIPRNHRVEDVIQSAVQQNDFHPFQKMLEVVTRPYDDQTGDARYAAAPEPNERVLQTFCGT